MSLDLDLDQFHDHINGTGICVEEIESQNMDMSTTGRLNGQNQAEKRAHHNALERKRRDHIKGSFSDLRDVIPSLKGEKASRAHVLKSATEHIHTLKTNNHATQKTIEELKRQNAILELQTQLLERIKETSHYARQININHHQEHTIKIESDLNGIQTTRNLLTNDTDPPMSSHS